MTVLFDMDGTLTPARGEMKLPIARKIAELTAYEKVGIVTGSGLDYVYEQCGILDEMFNLNREKYSLSMIASLMIPPLTNMLLNNRSDVKV